MRSLKLMKMRKGKHASRRDLHQNSRGTGTGTLVLVLLTPESSVSGVARGKARHTGLIKCPPSPSFRAGMSTIPLVGNFCGPCLHCLFVVMRAVQLLCYCAYVIFMSTVSKVDCCLFRHLSAFCLDLVSIHQSYQSADIMIISFLTKNRNF